MSLTVEDRTRVTTGLMRWFSRIWESISLSKVELYAAVAATDGWIEDNQASFNSALPEAARTNLDLAQKTLVFMAVAAARVSMAAFRKFFGRVD